MAVAAARAVEARKGQDIMVLDLRGRSQVADFFVLATGRVDAHLTALCRAVAEALAGIGCRALSRGEAVTASGWALLDYGPLVVHAFTPELRGYYDMELLWGDCPRVDWEESSE